MAVAVIQVALIFSFAATLFPKIQLPPLEIPNNWPAFISVVLITALAAVSYAMFIGAFVKTQVQANGLGAISVIIFAALGGIWVPVFMMPDYLQKISLLSPLRQSLDAFYTLFLKGGNWVDLSPSLLNLVLFIALCQIAAWAKFRMDKIV
jgi:ABC-2 type transport system permease protein